ncbi:MAG: transcriptional regulator [Byssovorax sp.]
MTEKAPPTPDDRAITPRAVIHEALLGGAKTARELSVRASIREKDVEDHLEHLERSARAKGERLVIKPASCLACGLVFSERRRFTTPGSCPRCQSERITPAAFRIEASSAGKQPRDRGRSRDRDEDDDDDDDE